MLNDFSQLIASFFSSLSTFLATPPVLYVVGFLLFTIILSVYIYIVRGGK